MHTLGSGAFAVVKLALHVGTGRRVALKIYSFNKIDTRIKREAIEQEINCMKQLASTDCCPKLFADF